MGTVRKNFLKLEFLDCHLCTQTSFVGGCELGLDRESPKALDLVGLCTLLVSETALVHYTPRPKGMAASPVPEPTGKEAIDEKCLGPRFLKLIISDFLQVCCFLKSLLAAFTGILIDIADL